MLSVWRLTTARFARSAFSGDGARLYGGRCNNKGVPLVYTSSTQALAMLEMLAQDEPLRARYVVIEARIPAHVKIDSRFWAHGGGDAPIPSARTIRTSDAL